MKVYQVFARPRRKRGRPPKQPTAGMKPCMFEDEGGRTGVMAFKNIFDAFGAVSSMVDSGGGGEMEYAVMPMRLQLPQKKVAAVFTGGRMKIIKIVNTPEWMGQAGQ